MIFYKKFDINVQGGDKINLKYKNILKKFLFYTSFHQEKVEKVFQK